MYNKRPPTPATLHPLEPRRLLAATLSLSSPTTSESAPSATFKLTLSAPLARPLTLSFATASRTAIAGSDFTTKSGPITIPAGSTTARIKVPLLNDNRVERPNETFRLRVWSLPSSVKLAKPFATATITDDEPRPTRHPDHSVTALPPVVLPWPEDPEALIPATYPAAVAITPTYPDLSAYPTDYSLIDRSYSHPIPPTWHGDLNVAGLIALIERHPATPPPETTTTTSAGACDYADTIPTTDDFMLIDHTFITPPTSLSPEFLAIRYDQFGPDYVLALLAPPPTPT